jgi:cellobiose transport system substrate-binding protein
MPSVLQAHTEAFGAEHGVTVQFVTYPTSTEARDAYLAGLAVGGAGVGDVILVEGDHWNTVAGQNPEDFVALPEIPGRWVGWAEDEGRVNGTLLGYRTDIGPVSVMYNARLLEEHGFGQYADPAAFSEWIGGANATWDTYLDAGREWRAATGIAFVDSISDGPLRAALRQIQPSAFENPATGNPIPLADNTAAHDTFMKFANAMTEHIGAGVPFWDGAWGSAMTQGEFLTMVAPPWQIGWPLRAAGGPDGDWRIATVFPGGGANWGGSFAAVPAHGANTDCAVALADWITNNDGGAALWSIGSVPSQQALLDAGLTNEPGIQGFLGGQDYAPVLTNLADHMPAANYRGSRFGFIQDDLFFNNLASVQDGINTPQQAWDTAVSEFNAQGWPTD